jgi:hypothetical protein
MGIIVLRPNHDRGVGLRFVVRLAGKRLLKAQMTFHRIKQWR